MSARRRGTEAAPRPRPRSQYSLAQVLQSGQNARVGVVGGGTPMSFPRSAPLQLLSWRETVEIPELKAEKLEQYLRARFQQQQGQLNGDPENPTTERHLDEFWTSWLDEWGRGMYEFPDFKMSVTMTEDEMDVRRLWEEAFRAHHAVRIRQLRDMYNEKAREWLTDMLDFPTRQFLCLMYSKRWKTGAAERDKHEREQAAVEVLFTIPEALNDADLALMLFTSLSSQECRTAGRLCGVKKGFNDVCKMDTFWKMLCVEKGWDGGDMVPEPTEANPLPWRARYIAMCTSPAAQPLPLYKRVETFSEWADDAALPMMIALYASISLVAAALQPMRDLQQPDSVAPEIAAHIQGVLMRLFQNAAALKFMHSLYKRRLWIMNQVNVARILERPEEYVPQLAVFMAMVGMPLLVVLQSRWRAEDSGLEP